MIAAGVNAKALSTNLVHTSSSISLDSYGHLLPGNEPSSTPGSLHKRSSQTPRATRKGS